MSMSRLIKVSARAPAGFFRAGRHWPREGVVVDAEVLGEALVARLEAEPNLRIEPADAGATPAQAAEARDALKARLRAAIAALAPEAFGSSGAPNLAPLRAALPGDAGAITSELRDEVWAELKPAG